MEKFLFKLAYAPANNLAVYLKAGLGRIITDFDHFESTYKQTEYSSWVGSGGPSYPQAEQINGGRSTYGVAGSISLISPRSTPALMDNTTM